MAVISASIITRSLLKTFWLSFIIWVTQSVSLKSFFLTISFYNNDVFFST